MTEARKTVVTLWKGVDGVRFLEEMAATSGADFIPNHAVEVYNEKPHSISNFDFVMTLEEAKLVRRDPRVRDVRWGSKKELGIFAKPDTIDDIRNYDRTSYVSNPLYTNWGLIACSKDQPYSKTNAFEARLDDRFNYTLTGRDVDVVISDDGIQVAHPEFSYADQPGVSRVEQIDWIAASGMTEYGPQDPSYYISNTEGHGTHVASIVAGNLYGWAKEASLYSMAVISLNGNAPASWMYGPTDSFNLIRGFHQNKTNGRPTIVNASWTFFSRWDWDTGWFRGEYLDNYSNQYPAVDPSPERAMRDFGHPIRVTSADSDIEDLIAAGVIVVSSAGNNYTYIDEVGGQDWMNRRDERSGFNTRYYCRGGTPGNTVGVITVGNIDSDLLTLSGGSEVDKMQFASSRGPGVDIWAPGTNIQGAISKPNGFNPQQVNPQPYPGYPAFESCKLTGTSFAAPQVAGVLAQHCQLNPDINSFEAKQWIIDNAEVDRIYDDTSGPSEDNFANDYALNGSPNRFLRNPYVSPNVVSFSGDVSFQK
jgi:hypothetical protein